MIRMALTAAVIAILPGVARADWVHKPTGLRVPDRIGDDLSKGETRDASGGEQANIWVQYGTGDDAATLYVYRSAYPDAGLWFHRTETAMRGNVGLAGDSPPPTELKLFGAAVPNALRQTYALDSAAKGYRSTALMIVNHGEWLLKIRLSSKSLDAGALGERLDRFAASMRIDSAETGSIAHVADCTAAPSPAIATPVTDRDEQMRTLVEGGTIAQMAARGSTGLAKNETNWCRESNAALAPIATLYRAKGGSDWIMLIGDSGVAATTASTFIETKPKRSGLFLQTPTSTALIGAFEQPPAVDVAIRDYLGPVLSGRRQPIASVRSDLKK